MNGKKKLGSNEEMTRAYLKSAFEHMLAAGRSVRDMVEFSLERFGDGLIPELKGFLDQVQSGEVKVKGLSQGAREALFGMQMTPTEREELVRLAAYVRAERRGFVGGSPDDDWNAAEREVDQMLAEKVGLVAKGRRALSEAGLAVDRELGDIKSVVGAWLEERSRPASVSGDAGTEKESEKPAPKKQVAKKAAKKDAAGKGAGGKEPAKTAAAPADKKSSKAGAPAGTKKPSKK